MASDYAEERKAKMRAIHTQIRRRSRDMEYRVMKILRGNRIPMSGAGSMKGDGQVSSERYDFNIVVECKYSACIHDKGPNIRIDFRWFDKLRKDTQSMRAKFGVLIFHMHGMQEDYVCVPAEIMETLFNIQVCEFNTIDARGKNGYTAFKNVLENLIPLHDSMVILQTPLYNYVIMRVRKFRDLIHY